MKLKNHIEEKLKQIILHERQTLEEIWPEEFLEEVFCPLCGSQKREKPYPQFYPRLKRCLFCSLIYTSPRLKKEYLAKLYTREYFKNKNSSVFGYHDYLADEERIRHTFQRRLELIEKLQKPGKLLDLGCATGFFLSEAQKRGWEPTGVEISSFAATYAQNKLHLPVIQADLKEIDFPKSTFDLITFWDVIEHIANPLGTLRRVKSFLKDDGLLVFSTPDVGSLPARLTGANWIGYKLSDEHLTYFSLQTLSLLCEKTGFKIVKKHHLGKYVSYPLFVNRVGLYSQSLRRVLQGLSKFIPEDFSFYVSAFDILCLYVRKK